jgi:hypothetical protein
VFGVGLGGGERRVDSNTVTTSLLSDHNMTSMPRVASCRFVPGACLKLFGSCRFVSNIVCMSRGSCHACRGFVCVSIVSGSVCLIVFLCVSACHACRVSRVSRVTCIKIIACLACRVSCVSGFVAVRFVSVSVSCVFAVRVCFCAYLI